MEKSMNSALRPLAVVTGGSTGIGFELAQAMSREWIRRVIAADREVQDSYERLRGLGGGWKASRPTWRPRQAWTSSIAKLNGRRVDALLANAGHGLGKGIPRSELR